MLTFVSTLLAYTVIQEVR